MIMDQRFTRDLLFVGICSLIGLGACGSEGPQGASNGDSPATSLPAAGDPHVEDRAGSVELALNVADTQLDSISYTIVGSGFTTTGNLDVSHSTRVSGLVGGIPFGTNYALTMTGKGAGTTPLTCSGSASFDVLSVGPLPVTIPISCKELPVSEPIPAPVPLSAVLTLACALAALGVVAQRRATRG